MPLETVSVLDAIKNNGAKILVHGPSGSGKTVLCKTTKGKTLIISAESGLLSLQKYALADPDDFERIEVAVVKDFDELDSIRKSLKKKNPYEWVCLDSISEIAEQVLAKEKDGTPDMRKAYGALQDSLAKLLRQFRDLDCNVYMSCKQERIQDEDSMRTMYRMMLPGKKLPQAVPYMFDEVFALRVAEDEDEDGEVEEIRKLQTQRSTNYDCKDRSGILEKFEDPDLSSIVAKFEKGGMKRKKKKGKKK